MFKDKRKFIEYCFIIFLGVLGLIIIENYFNAITSNFSKFIGILSPFTVGIVIAYLLNPVVKLIVRKTKINRGLSIGIVYISIIILLALFLNILIPSIITSSSQIVSDASTGITTINQWLTEQEYGTDQVTKLLYENLQDIIARATEMTGLLFDNIKIIFLTITSTLLNTFFGIVISIYVLLDKDKLLGGMKKFIVVTYPKGNSESFLKYLHEMNHLFSRFLSGLIIEALVVGSLAFIGFSFMGLQHAMILAIIICFTNVIPYVGPFLGAIPAIIVTALYNPMLALGVLAFMIVLQQLDGNLIGPKIMGSFINMSPFWIILSITIGGGFWGIPGVIIGIPTGAMIKILLTDYLDRRISENPELGEKFIPKL